MSWVEVCMLTRTTKAPLSRILYVAVLSGFILPGAALLGGCQTPLEELLAGEPAQGEAGPLMTADARWHAGSLVVSFERDRAWWQQVDDTGALAQVRVELLDAEGEVVDTLTGTLPLSSSDTLSGGAMYWRVDRPAALRVWVWESGTLLLRQLVDAVGDVPEVAERCDLLGFDRCETGRWCHPADSLQDGVGLADEGVGVVPLRGNRSGRCLALDATVWSADHGHQASPRHEATLDARFELPAWRAPALPPLRVIDSTGYMQPLDAWVREEDGAARALAHLEISPGPRRADPRALRYSVWQGPHELWTSEPPQSTAWTLDGMPCDTDGIEPACLAGSACLEGACRRVDPVDVDATEAWLLDGVVRVRVRGGFDFARHRESHRNTLHVEVRDHRRANLAEASHPLSGEGHVDPTDERAAAYYDWDDRGGTTDIALPPAALVEGSNEARSVMLTVVRYHLGEVQNIDSIALPLSEGHWIGLEPGQSTPVATGERCDAFEAFEVCQRGDRCVDVSGRQWSRDYRCAPAER